MITPLITTTEVIELASGDSLALQIYKFIGGQPGRKAYIQSNLHGVEIVGNAVIHQLIDFLSSLDKSQIDGEIWLVPACNPLGTNQRMHFFSTGRFNSYDGKDWNRIFWDYEKFCPSLDEFVESQINASDAEIRDVFLSRQIADFQKEWSASNSSKGMPYSKRYRHQLQSLCLDANYVIDIHSSSNQSIDYTYCFNTREDSAKYFLLEHGILMTEYDGDAFDEAFMKPWLALEKKFAERGRNIKFDVESWTLELGSGMQMNPESVKKGVVGIKNYLSHKGILKSNNYPVAPTEIKLVAREQVHNYYAPAGGMIQDRLPLRSRVKPGDKLYQLLKFNKKGGLPTLIDVRAETGGFIFDLSTNHSVNQGEYILGILAST